MNRPLGRAPYSPGWDGHAAPNSPIPMQAIPMAYYPANLQMQQQMFGGEISIAPSVPGQVCKVLPASSHWIGIFVSPAVRGRNHGHAKLTVIGCICGPAFRSVGNFLKSLSELDPTKFEAPPGLLGRLENQCPIL